MIFLTTGTQLGFNRLLIMVDRWAATSNSDVVAQIGSSTYTPTNIKWMRFMNSSSFHDHIAKAETIVSHAGMGSIIQSMDLGKPVILVPRRMELNEHRNNHQVATCNHLCTTPGIYIAWTESDLARYLNQRQELSPPNPNNNNLELFIENLHNLINEI